MNNKNTIQQMQNLKSLPIKIINLNIIKSKITKTSKLPKK